jgi:hypothetical protein
MVKSRPRIALFLNKSKPFALLTDTSSKAAQPRLTQVK